MAIRRINLSFSLERKDDLEVYNILSKQKYKTDYVIKAVLSYMGKRDKDFNKETVKQAIKEALREYGIDSKDLNKIENNEEKLPGEIFDMFNTL